MNPKIALAAAASAVVAAGLTFVIMSGGSGNARLQTQPSAAEPPAKSARSSSSAQPSRPTLVIPPAGPSPAAEEPAAVPAPPAVASTRPSPLGTPINKPAATPSSEPPVATAPPPQPAQPAPTPSPEPPVAPAVPLQRSNPPPQRTELYPPKDVDRVQPAILHERSASNAGPNTATLDAGTLITVRLGETLTTQKNLVGDTFFGTLETPLVAGGFVIAEKGARVEGKVTEVDKAGKMSGSARISIELTQVNTSDGQRIHLQTSPYTRDGADRNRKGDVAKIGGGAVLGAIIGAAAGGGKGAAVGAGAGGAAGAGAVLLSGGRNLTIPVETKLNFRVEKPVALTERVVQ